MSNYTMFTASVNPRLEDNTVMITQDLAELFGLSPGEKIHFRVGHFTKLLSITERKQDKLKNNMTFSPTLIKNLYLKKEQSYGVKMDKKGLHLGPVVGITADLFNDRSRPFGNQSFFFQQLLNAGRNMGEICFVFSPASINWSKGTVFGYTYGNKGWVRSTFPIPEVTYPRERGFGSNHNNYRRRLEKLGTRFFNPPVVGKWETYQIMKRNNNLAKYLPETKLIRNFNQVDEMVKKYKSAYLKPTTGSRGKNIIKINKKKSSGYEYQYEINNLIIKGNALTLSRLQSALRKVMGNRSYIVQEPINLLQLDDNIIDVRILVQKNDLGKWETTGIACRQGKKGSITSNISSGGSGKKLDAVLLHNFADDSRRKNIMEEVCFLAIESAKTLEKAIGPSGEMGIDIGIDKSGEVWFIETNLRPARHVFLLIGEQETRLRSVEMPMLYLRYLAGFTSKER